MGILMPTRLFKHLIQYDFSLQVSKMFENIRTVYVDKINNARWLDPETKERLTNILNSMQKHVGYPKWMNDVTQYKTVS